MVEKDLHQWNDWEARCRHHQIHVVTHMHIFLFDKLNVEVDKYFFVQIYV